MRKLVFAALVFFSCGPAAPDLDTEQKAIERLLEQERRAHFERNADLFISEFADSMISVNRGRVITNTPEKRRAGIQSYFSASESIKWDDVAPPLIRFSEDGSLAYAVIQKQ